MKKFHTMTTGQIVACNYQYAAIFRHYGIDFCCQGNVPLKKACEKAGIDSQTLIKELEKEDPRAYFTVDFQSWPTDLLLDFILKFHHRRSRSEGALINELAEKVLSVHGVNHPELRAIRQLVQEAMIDLENHLGKKEQVLFPYLSEMTQSLARGLRPGSFHCGTIKSPIAVMMAEHETEGERWREIHRLTDGYTTPDDGCATYWLFMERLKLFEEGLHHHIHLENNIVFPRAIAMEQSIRQS